MQSLIAEGYFI